MLLMSKRKTTDTKAAAGAKTAERKTGRARDLGLVETLSTEIEKPLHDAFTAFYTSRRPKINKRAAVEWAIEELLAKHGALPENSEP